MEIFTEDAKKEIKRYLPHYIVGSGFLAISLICANLCTTVITKKIDGQVVAKAPEQVEQEMQENIGPLPSEIEIGLPYTEAIKDKSKPLLLEFFADWCPHSRRLTPIVAEISEERSDINFTTVNTQVAENYYLSKKYKVDKFPFIVLIDTKTGNFQEIFLEDTSFSKEGLSKQIDEKLSKIK